MQLATGHLNLPSYLPGRRVLFAFLWAAAHGRGMTPERSCEEASDPDDNDTGTALLATICT